MKGRIIQGLVQYLSALLLLACAFFAVHAYDAEKLPMSGRQKIEAQNENPATGQKPAKPAENAPQSQPSKQTAGGFASSLKKADKNTTPYPGIYGEGCRLVYRPLSGVKLTEGDVPGVRMGCLVVKDESGKIKAVYDSALRDVTEKLKGYSLTFLRDGSGRPLFRNKADGTYACLSDGGMEKAEYDPVNFDKGLADTEYPSYRAFRGENFEVFGENGFFGLRKRGGGDVVLPAVYADVFGVREGYCVAVDAESTAGAEKVCPRLRLFKADGTLINGDCFAPKKEERNASALGYFFVDKGLTRARSKGGREMMLRADGSEFLLPSGFSVAAYSDGALLLKGQNGYGYMLYDGSWICAPEYKEALPFREGLAAVRGKNGLWGMTDLRGNTVIPMLFDRIESSSDGVILAYSAKYGYKLFNKTAS